MKPIALGIIKADDGVFYFSLARIMTAIHRAGIVGADNLVTELQCAALDADEAANQDNVLAYNRRHMTCASDTIRCSCGDVIDVAEMANHDRNVHGIDPRPRLAGAKRWE